MNKFDAIKTYLLGEGNYDFPFNKYVESVQLKTGERLHPFVYYREFFLDDLTASDGMTRLTNAEFARLVKDSPDYNPDDPFVWYEDGKLHSSKTVFPDICDVDKVAAWCVENNDDLDIDDTIHDILFGKEE